jgi:hypothetical protein
MKKNPIDLLQQKNFRTCDRLGHINASARSMAGIYYVMHLRYRVTEIAKRRA